MGHGSVGKGAGNKVPFPSVIRRRNRSLLPVVGNESLEQLANRFTVDLITVQFVGVGYCQASAFAGGFYAGAPDVGAG